MTPARSDFLKFGSPGPKAARRPAGIAVSQADMDLEPASGLPITPTAGVSPRDAVGSAVAPIPLAAAGRPPRQVHRMVV